MAPCEVLKGLEAFREHLGGHLTVLMLTGIGRGKDVHEIDAALMEECIREMPGGRPLLRPGIGAFPLLPSSFYLEFR